MLQKRHEKGQGLVEYSLIILLIALVVLSAVALVGPQVSGIFSQVVSGLS
jgi:pilus assembly protein Flp/PilA